MQSSFSVLVSIEKGERINNTEIKCPGSPEKQGSATGIER